jgi:hypothetical protein
VVLETELKTRGRLSTCSAPKLHPQFLAFSLKETKKAYHFSRPYLMTSEGQWSPAFFILGMTWFPSGVEAREEKEGAKVELVSPFPPFVPPHQAQAFAAKLRLLSVGEN